MFESGLTFLHCEDIERTTKFYTEILDLPLVLDQGGCRIFRINDGSFIGFCQRPVPTTKGTIITFVDNDVDGWAERLKQKGVKLEKEPTHNVEYLIYHIFFRDPDGYLLEIQRFDDPDWKESCGCITG